MSSIQIFIRICSIFLLVFTSISAPAAAATELEDSLSLINSTRYSYTINFQPLADDIPTSFQQHWRDFLADMNQDRNYQTEFIDGSSVRTHLTPVLAEQMRADDRVKALTHSSVLEQLAPLFIPQHLDDAIYAATSRRVVIGEVDSGSSPGAFQEVVLEHVEDQHWQLRQMLKAYPVNGVNEVEVIVTDSFPIQVFLKISGELSGCEEIGRISKRIVGDSFSVNVYLDNDYILRRPYILCPAAFFPFSTTVPLQVYGLAAGEYSYSVNNNIEGTFTLAQDNTLE